VSLSHALLALLDAGPMTGYELTKQFDQSADRVWHATHPQIYTELRRLEGAGLVTAREVPRGPKAKAVKRAYALTEEGGAELRRWVAEIEAPQRVRDVAYLRPRTTSTPSPRPYASSSRRTAPTSTSSSSAGSGTSSSCARGARSC
jgi:DNA-binding PadR family transcriptional regulator